MKLKSIKSPKFFGDRVVEAYQTIKKKLGFFPTISDC